MRVSLIKNILGIFAIVLLLLILKFIYIDSSETFDNNYHDKPFVPNDESESGKTELENINKINDIAISTQIKNNKVRAEAAEKAYQNALNNETQNEKNAKMQYKNDLDTWNNQTNQYNICIEKERAKIEADKKLKLQYKEKLNNWNNQLINYNTCVDNEKRAQKMAYKADMQNWNNQNNIYNTCVAKELKDAADLAEKKRLAAEAEQKRIDAENAATAERIRLAKEAEDAKIAAIGRAQYDIDMKAKQRYDTYWQTPFNPIVENGNWAANDGGVRYSAEKLLRSEIVLNYLQCMMYRKDSDQDNYNDFTTLEKSRKNLAYFESTYNPSSEEGVPDMNNERASLLWRVTWRLGYSSDLYYDLKSADSAMNGWLNYPVSARNSFSYSPAMAACLSLFFIKGFFKENPDLPISWDYFTTTKMYYSRLNRSKNLYLKLAVYIAFMIETKKLTMADLYNIDSTPIGDANLKAMFPTIDFPALYAKLQNHTHWIASILKGKPAPANYNYSNADLSKIPVLQYPLRDKPIIFKPNNKSDTILTTIYQDADSWSNGCPGTDLYAVHYGCVKSSKPPGVNKCENGLYIDKNKVLKNDKRDAAGNLTVGAYNTYICDDNDRPKADYWGNECPSTGYDWVYAAPHFASCTPTKKKIQMTSDLCPNNQGLPLNCGPGCVNISNQNGKWLCTNPGGAWKSPICPAGSTLNSNNECV